VSYWLAGGGTFNYQEMGNEVSTNVYDQLFFLFVLVGSLVVTLSRRLRWAKILSANAAVMLFYIYFALSVCWSGDPTGSLKRIIKDFGLLAVIGVLFSEENPLQAIRAVYARCAFILIPLSVVLVKYFPTYARVYSKGGGPTVTGVTGQKNSLGELLLVLTMFLVWDLLDTRRQSSVRFWRRIPWDIVIILLMDAWLLRLSQSSTATVCTFIGVFLISRSRRFASKPINWILFAGALSLPFLLFFSQQFSSVLAPLLASLGRDITFTGRSNIWAHVTSETVNPLIGAGFWNFWGGPGGYAISKAMDTVIPTAHDGYLDIYLDGGIFGLVFLFVLFVAGGNRILKKFNRNRDADHFLRLRLAIFVVAIIYNLFESNLARLSPMWFTTLLAIVEFPGKTVVQRARAAVYSSSTSIARQDPHVLVSQRTHRASSPALYFSGESE
jgi:O-antigen ligase